MHPGTLHLKQCPHPPWPHNLHTSLCSLLGAHMFCSGGVGATKSLRVAATFPWRTDNQRRRAASTWSTRFVVWPPSRDWTPANAYCAHTTWAQEPADNSFSAPPTTGQKAHTGEHPRTASADLHQSHVHEGAAASCSRLPPVGIAGNGARPFSRAGCLATSPAFSFVLAASCTVNGAIRRCAESVRSSTVLCAARP